VVGKFGWSAAHDFRHAFPQPEHSGGFLLKQRHAGTFTNGPQLAKEIFSGYRPTKGCPPFEKHSVGDEESRIVWRRAFSRVVADNEDRAAAWNRLKGRCDTSLLIELFYLFTYRGEVLGDRTTDEYRLLERRLDKIISLHKRMDRELQRVMHDHWRGMAHFDTYLETHLKLLGEGLLLARERANLWGSRKTNVKDWYLYLIGEHVGEATGSLNLPDVVTLLEAASLAFGDERPVFNEAMIKQRIQRYRKRFTKRLTPPKLPTPPAPSRDDQDIPF
jgi:hypothetical protein